MAVPVYRVIENIVKLVGIEPIGNKMDEVVPPVTLATLALAPNPDVVNKEQFVQVACLPLSDESLNCCVTALKSSALYTAHAGLTTNNFGNGVVGVNLGM